MYPECPYPTISVIVCTLNEERNLSYVLPNIPAWIDEILLVDGHSTDKTVDVAKELRPDIRVVYQPLVGKGDALRYGIRHADGDIIVTLDADGATDPKDIRRIIEPLFKGYDFVKGTRFASSLPSGKSPHRIFGNLLIAAIFNILYGSRYTDLCSGYNAFWKWRLDRVNLDSGDYFEDEPLLVARVKRAGLKIVEIGYHDPGRIFGEGKAPSWRQGFIAVKTIIRERLRSRRAMQHV